MFGIIKRMFLDKKNALLAYALAIVAFMEMYLALYPSIRDQAAQLNQLLEAYPDSFFKAFGLDRADLTFARVEPYLSSEIFSFIGPIMLIIFMTSMANYAIVGEIGKGTIELTLAQPISRLKIFFSRLFTAVLNLTVFSAVMTFAVVPLASFHNIDYTLDNFLKMGIIVFLFGFAVLGIAIFFSALFSERGKASFATGGVLILMYVVNVVSGLKENLDKLKYFSFFHYYTPGTVLGKGQFIDYSFPVFLGAGLMFMLAAAYWFNRRDIAV